MSQRTHGPTTGAGNRKPSNAPSDSDDARAARGADASPRARRSTPRSTAASPAEGTPLPLDPRAVARLLRVVADEVERDPALARRVASAATELERPRRDADSSGTDPEQARRAGGGRPSGVGTKPFTARIVKGAPLDLGPGIPDPFALRVRLGRDGLCAALEELRLGTLRAMVREYHLDASGGPPPHNDAARLRQVIVAATDTGR